MVLGFFSEKGEVSGGFGSFFQLRLWKRGSGSVVRDVGGERGLSGRKERVVIALKSRKIC